MLNKIYQITIFIIVFIFITFGCFNKTVGLDQSDIKPIVEIFLSKHVKYLSLNDEISEKTLNNILKYLDPGKYYFFKSDIDYFLKNKFKIDNFVIDREYDFIFEIFEIYKNRFKDGLIIFDELIETKYNFNIDESIIIDRDKVNYSQSKEDMRQRWRKNIKLQLLNQLSSNSNEEKAKKKLKKKYGLIKKRMDEIDNAKMISIFLNSFSTALDPHSNYLTQEEHEDFMISTNLKLEGIGVLLRSEDGFVIVESIIPGGAAAKLSDELKLKPNDKIIAVAQKDQEPVDVVDMDLRDVVKLIRGAKGTEVRLTIIRDMDEAHKQGRITIPIIREEIKLKDRAAKSQSFTMKKNTYQFKIGFIKLPSFYLDFNAIHSNDPNARSSSRDVVIEIDKLKNEGIDGLILDLRGNPGGLLPEAINLAGIFIDQGAVVQITDGRNNVNVLRDDSPGVHYNGPIVVLIDKFSASASEIFAGAIKDYRRGLILGPTSTFGKGSVQTYNMLPNKKGAIKITSALFYQPSGTSNQLNGISPHITIPDISSVWEIGENKLRNPINWERIERAKFIPYKNYLNKKMLSMLTERFSKRVKKNVKLNEIIEKIKNFRNKLNKKEISLKEEARIEEQKRNDIKNKFQKDQKDELIDIKNIEDDPFLSEALNITLDYLELLK